MSISPRFLDDISFETTAGRASRERKTEGVAIKDGCAGEQVKEEESEIERGYEDWRRKGGRDGIKREEREGTYSIPKPESTFHL